MILQPIRIQSGRTHLVSQPRVCRRHPSRLCLALAERPASEAAVAQALAGPHPALAEAPRGQIQGWDRATFHATNRRGKQGQRVLRLKRPVLRRRRQRQRRDRRQRRRVGVGGWKAAVGGAGPLYHLELERFEHPPCLQPSPAPKVCLRGRKLRLLRSLLKSLNDSSTPPACSPAPKVS